MLARAPSVVQDAGSWGLAIAAVAALAGFAARGLRHVIRDEVPKAMEQAIPEVTRALVRDEVDRVVEPFAAQLHEEIRKTREEMRPNGGSTFRDELDRRFDEVDRRFNMVGQTLEDMQEGE